MTPDEARSILRLSLLGPPQMERDGVPVYVDTRKAVALAAYLAVTGQPHGRDSLAALLWPEYEPARAYANLRRTLWALGKAIGKEWLAADSDLISLHPAGGYWLDIDEFHAHLVTCAQHDHASEEACDACVSILTQAVALYRGDFLAGFSLRDSPAFDDWQFFEAESLRQEFSATLERLIRCLISGRRFETAILHARRWVALDPLHEPAQRRLMLLYAWSGQWSAALRQYNECARILEAELGAKPGIETEELKQAIESRQVPPPPGQPILEAETSNGTAAAAPASTAVLATETPPHNLPAQLTPFVGREDELAEIAALLDRPECRLLSLVGPGGIGKTRLALEAAGQMLRTPSRACAYQQGLFFISLGALESPAHITPAIAAAIGFSFYEREGQRPEEQLKGYLAGKSMLLILDNVEHLLVAPDDGQPGIRVLSELLPAAPAIKMLATSRERLNLQGEWVLNIEGMPYPRNGDDVEPVRSETPEYGAVSLFLQRARMVDGGFQPSAQEMVHLVHICQLIEGWPLGIELAAAWVNTLPVAQIDHEIQQGLDFLSTSLRDVPARHQSLRAVCDHSYRLLSPEERAIFRRLSVFRGGFCHEAAEAVTGVLLPDLRALLEKSLLHRLPGEKERYSLHQVLLQYAAARLAETPDESEQTHSRHCAHFAAFLAERSEDLRGHRQREALDEIATEVENVRAAWQWAVDHCRVTDLLQAAEALFRFWLVRKGFAEGEQSFGQAADELESPDCIAACQGTGLSTQRLRALGLVLAFQGHMAQYSVSRPAAIAIQKRGLEVLRPLGMGRELALANLHAAFWTETEDYGETEAALRDSLAYFEGSGDLWGVARCTHALAFDPLAEREKTKADLERSLALSETAGDWWGVAMNNFELGEGAHMAGLFGDALRHYSHCLEIRRLLGDRMGAGTVLDYMGYVTREMGHLDEARRLHKESLALSEEIGDRLGIAGSLDNLGLVALEQGRYQSAQRWMEKGLAHRRDLATGWEESISLQHLGSVALAQGDLEAAEARYRESLRLSQDLIWSQGTALDLIGLAQVLAAQDRAEPARKHAASALSLAGLLTNLVVTLEIALGAARVLRRTGQAAQAAELLELVSQHPASTAFARSAAMRDLGELADLIAPEELAATNERVRQLMVEQLLERAQAALSATLS